MHLDVLQPFSVPKHSATSFVPFSYSRTKELELLTITSPPVHSAHYAKYIWAPKFYIACSKSQLHLWPDSFCHRNVFKYHYDCLYHSTDEYVSVHSTRRKVIFCRRIEEILHTKIVHIVQCYCLVNKYVAEKTVQCSVLFLFHWKRLNFSYVFVCFQNTIF